MATYAIGDVQGCFLPLQSLLERLNYRPATDFLWFVGDLVNRGPQSLDTLRYVRDLGARAVTVLGNHDLHLLSVAAGIAKAGKGDTLAEILAAPDRDELLAWLRAQPLLHREAGYVLVHAGLLPQWTSAQAAELAREVETALRGNEVSRFFEAMYGNEPREWSDTHTGTMRLRAITNVMTRLRVCTATGVMDFDYKGPVQSIPPGYMPWFDAPGRHSAGDILIVGHWSALGVRNESNLIALDSGCFWGGQLTAVRLEDRQVFQVNCR